MRGSGPVAPTMGMGDGGEKCAGGQATPRGHHKGTIHAARRCALTCQGGDHGTPHGAARPEGGGRVEVFSQLAVFII